MNTLLKNIAVICLKIRVLDNQINGHRD